MHHTRCSARSRSWPGSGARRSSRRASRPPSSSRSVRSASPPARLPAGPRRPASGRVSPRPAQPGGRRSRAGRLSPLQPRPCRSARPGVAPVWPFSSATTVPLTITTSIPTGSRRAHRRRVPDGRRIEDHEIGSAPSRMVPRSRSPSRAAGHRSSAGQPPRARIPSSRTNWPRSAGSCRPRGSAVTDERAVGPTIRSDGAGSDGSIGEGPA